LQAQKWHFRAIFAFSGIFFSRISHFFTFAEGFGHFRRRLRACLHKKSGILCGDTALYLSADSRL
jgi:hypothetical protein